eukprot:6200635-Pleurochrysis_carterae.AAC.3
MEGRKQIAARKASTNRRSGLKGLVWAVIARAPSCTSRTGLRRRCWPRAARPARRRASPARAASRRRAARSTTSSTARRARATRPAPERDALKTTQAEFDLAGFSSSEAHAGSCESERAAAMQAGKPCSCALRH